MLDEVTGDLRELPRPGAARGVGAAALPHVTLRDLHEPVGRVGVEAEVGVTVLPAGPGDLSLQRQPQCQAWQRGARFTAPVLLYESSAAVAGRSRSAIAVMAGRTSRSQTVAKSSRKVCRLAASVVVLSAATRRRSSRAMRISSTSANGSSASPLCEVSEIFGT